MNTWLYLTAEELTAAPSADWPCCVWSSTGQRQLMPLKEAAPILDGQAVDLLLPMELCSWVCSDPWLSRRQPDAQALAYAVEEQLGEPLDAVHLSVGARDSDGRYPMMVIGRERFGGVLALLAESGIEVRAVFVDADLLPLDQACAVWWFGRWILGGQLPARLALSDEAATQLQTVLPQDLHWLDSRHTAAEDDQWLSPAHRQAINLLHGEFAPRQKMLSWRMGALGILTLLLFSWGAVEARVDYLEGETRRLYTQSEQRFRALFPEQTRIVDMPMQLKALQRQPVAVQNTRTADLINLIEQVIGASNVHVQRIEFRLAEGWKVQLWANSFAELEQLRERGRQQGMPVRLDSANREGNRVQATLTLEQET